MSTPKVGRNNLCPCGSGHKYKYCCIAIAKRDRKILLWEDKSINAELWINLAESVSERDAQESLPLKNFCKDNNLYLFGLAITTKEQEYLNTQIKNQTLSRQNIIDVYKTNCTQEHIMNLLTLSCKELNVFDKRKGILFDAFEAHFQGKFSLSIPVLFNQLEGLLRDLGNLQNKDNVKPTIETNIWENKLLFGVKDDAEFFNHFIHKLFEGNSNSEQLNRNPISHGFKIDYANEDDSLILLLAILEIRLFKWWDNNSEDFSKRFHVTTIQTKQQE